jgi:hypothetical protein
MVAAFGVRHLRPLKPDAVDSVVIGFEGSAIRAAIAVDASRDELSQFHVGTIIRVR